MPRIMGIVNTTPDSFSDGGRCILPGDALDHALRLEDAGADILDIGGESTRPYSEPVPGDEELRRVIPVLEKLRTKTRLPISIDTSKARVAKAAIEAGAEIINDVTGLTGDSQMLEVAVNSRAGVCAMHMQGTPQTMQDAPTYQDVVDDILQYLAERSSVMIDAGIAHASIVLDPGIGFGKTHEHNLRLLREVRRFHALGFALLVGPWLCRGFKWCESIRLPSIAKRFNCSRRVVGLIESTCPKPRLKPTGLSGNTAGHQDQ
jgi:dihydropteroate synthase